MRNFSQLLVAFSLLANQVVAGFPHVATVQAANVPTAQVEQIVQLNLASVQGITAKEVKVPDFDAEVVAPLRAKQAAEAAAKAAAEAAKLAAQRAVSHPATTGVLNNDQITFLGNCESGMTANRNSGNGFYGAFQFTIGTWNGMATGYARADLAPLATQIDAVQRLLSNSSIFNQFPGCARQMQAHGLI